MTANKPLPALDLNLGNSLKKHIHRFFRRQYQKIGKIIPLS